MKNGTPSTQKKLKKYYELLVLILMKEKDTPKFKSGRMGDMRMTIPLIATSLLISVIST
jgi:hypothetical protein